MATEDEDVDLEENILYDLSIQQEWRLDNEIFTRSPRDKDKTSIIGRVASASARSIWTFLRTVGVPLQTATPCLLPEVLVKLVNSQINWHIAVGSEGRLVAVLQEQFVDIRSHRDGYESTVGRGVFPRDPCPQWRCVVWSPDSTMIACSRSCGAVDVFDIVGSPLFTIPGESTQPAPHDLSCAVAALIFTDAKPQDTAWSYELLVINYHGSLKSYWVDRDKGHRLRYAYVFGGHYPLGVSSAMYLAKHKVLLVGGCGYKEDDSSETSQAAKEGITAWRLLSDMPFVKLVTDYDADLVKLQKGMSFLSRLRLPKLSVWKGASVDGVYKMSISPGEDLLVVLHQSGKLSQWHLPSLRFKMSWPLESQPGFDEICPRLAENPQKRKRIKDIIPHKKLLDVNFWSNEALILARCTGAVTVCAVNTLKNLLGKSPEWFEPSPRVSETHNGGFLSIECELKFPKKKLVVADESEDCEDSEDEDMTWYNKTTRCTKQVLYYLTDNERFEPPRKKPRMVTRIYKLICLRSTTPEELYARKIDAEEYGEALALAKTYSLDCDLVYQRQWRKSPVSVASIQDYLSKISKRSWVLHECLERVPDNIDAMWELLQYGLRGTDLHALIVIGNGEDGGRFILCDPEEGLYEDMSFDEFNPESQRRKEEMKADKMKELLSQVDFDSLNLEQKELCRARLKLLQYIDRLKTYEHILGGQCAAAERFSAKFFKEFRSQNIVETTVDYARMSDVYAVEAMLTYHGADTLPHRLAILSNFPETTMPSEYKSLLPEMANSEDVHTWVESSWRDLDWSENEKCKSTVNPYPVDLGEFLYEERSDLQKFSCDKLSKSLLSQWYVERACEIERQSRLVDNALDLVKLAIQNRVEGLYELLDDLLTMEMLVYECNIEDSLSFKQLQDMADYEKLELIMSKSSEEMYIKNLRRWVVPFLKQCERRETGSCNLLLHDYIITKAKTDLSAIVKIFETSKAGVNQPVIQSVTDLMSFALEACYVCERDDQLDIAITIAQCLPTRSSKDPSDVAKLHNEVDKLENHLSAMKILQDYNIKKPIYYVKDSQGNPEETRRLMVKLTRLAGRNTPAFTELQWRKLHDDVMELQKKVFNGITTAACHEIYVESLLCSSSMDTIRLAGEMIERSTDDSKPSKQLGHRKVEYSRAVQLVLSAAQEYFNSSASLMDTCMDLARSCLNLIMDTPGAIQQELDLIASLALLDDFGVAILPLQVRLCTDRLKLVAEAVNKRPAAYKQSQKLLRLGHLLRVPGDTRAERDGKVLKLVGEAAVKAKDYEFAEDCCRQLIEADFSDSWTLCVDLAEQEDFSSVAAKVDLLSFAVTYCTPEMIEPILQAKCLLETQLLVEKVSTDLPPRTEESSPRSSPFSAKAAVQQTQQILSSTTKTTKAVFSTVTDGKWWKGAVQAMKQPTQRQTSVRLDDGNAGFASQGCHPFYESIIEDCYSNVSDANYLTGEMTTFPEVEMREKMFRTAKLEEMLTEGEKSQPAAEVLLELARMSLSRDSALGLAYLLALPKASDADKCFEEFPSTDVSLQLALYYYALQVYSSLNPSAKPLKYGLYHQDPSKVIRKVINHVTSRPSSDWPTEVVELVPKLEKYKEMLDDYNQAMSLKKLGRGVDVVRFADDPEYKQETILGLAMSLEEDVYKMSVSLAQRYDVSVWEVYMSHLEFLFTDSGLSTEEVEKRVNQLKIVVELTSKPEDFCDRMYKYVFPSVVGTDHDQLIYFFQLLEGCDLGRVQGQIPDFHVRLLRKIKHAAPGLDYRQLMDGKTPPLHVLQPVLTSNNINTLAKLAGKIPDGMGGFLHSSVVYSAWAVTQFWRADPSGKHPDSSSAWIHRYESCGEFVQKMLPEDLIGFIDSIVFSRKSREMLEMSCRQEIVRRALRFSRQQGGGASSKKKKQEDCGRMSWDEAGKLLQQRVGHLDNVNSDMIRSFNQAENPQYKKYAEMYDTSCGDTTKIQQLLVTMLADGETPDLVDDVLQVAPLGSWTVRTTVQEVVRHVVNKLRDPKSEHDGLGDLDVMSVLERVVVSVQDHEESGGDLVMAEDVMSLLRPFCSDSSVEVKPRLDVLHVLEKSFHLSTEDTALLTLYRTQALVTSAWKGQQVTETDITTEDSRMKLFENLLNTTTNKDQFSSLCRLLKLWPHSKSAHELGTTPSDNPWTQLFTTAVTTLGSDGGMLVNHVIRDVCEGRNPLDLECSREVYEIMLKEGQPVEGVKYLLQSGHATLFPVAMQTLGDQKEVVQDEDLLNLILKHQLATSVVKTNHYASLIDFLLEKQGSESVPDWLNTEKVAKQLSKSGYQAEAGALLLQSRSSHQVLHTFGAALGVLGKWLKKS